MCDNDGLKHLIFWNGGSTPCHFRTKPTSIVKGVKIGLKSFSCNYVPSPLFACFLFGLYITIAQAYPLSFPNCHYTWPVSVSFSSVVQEVNLVLHVSVVSETPVLLWQRTTIQPNLSLLFPLTNQILPILVKKVQVTSSSSEL
jgi:hypothetical protein